MSICLLVCLLFVVTVQFYFHAYFFASIYHKQGVQQPISHGVQQTPKVSVIIAARNEAENLRCFLPLIAQQEYSDFEIIVVNDRSEDDSAAVLSELSARFQHLQVLTIADILPGVNPKKRALEMAIAQAKGEYLLCTDADCQPLSTQWIAGMVAELKNNFQIVLGFSPYKSEPGILNRFIQFETLYTAVQYFSFTKKGRPYMSVGRNFLYKKALFFSAGGFDGIRHLNGGDDDLLLKRMATPNNTTLAFSPDTFVESIPKTTWLEYIKQKHRHLSVGVNYSYPHKIALGLLNSSHFLFYGYVCYSILFSYFVPLTMSVLAIRLLLVYRTYFYSGKTFNVYFFNPLEVFLFDFLYAVGYFFLGIVSLFYRSRVWK